MSHCLASLRQQCNCELAALGPEPAGLHDDHEASARDWQTDATHLGHPSEKKTLFQEKWISIPPSFLTEELPHGQEEHFVFFCTHQCSFGEKF